MHLNNLFNETIRKEGDKYVVRSKKGKSMGSYDSKSAAEKRLRQVEMFKHMAESIKLSEAERDIQVEVPGIGVYTADTLSSNIIQSIDKLHRAAEAGDWEQVEYSLDPSKMGATLLTKAQALVQALKQNRLLEAEGRTAFDPAKDITDRAKSVADKTRARVASIPSSPTVATEPAVARPKPTSTVTTSSGPGSIGDEITKKFGKPKLVVNNTGSSKGSSNKSKGNTRKPINNKDSSNNVRDIKSGSSGGKNRNALSKALKSPKFWLKRGIPGVYSGMAAIDAYQHGKAGNYGDALSSALAAGTGLIPYVGPVVGSYFDPAMRKARKELGIWNPLDPKTNESEIAQLATLVEFIEHLDGIETEVLGEAGKDACYHKVRSRYKVWPSAYASGALVQCRKKGAKNWGNKSKKK
jgi:hypothetical protein